jgi:hypothetical protein
MNISLLHGNSFFSLSQVTKKTKSILLLYLIVSFNVFHSSAQTKLIGLTYGKFNDSTFSRKINDLYKIEYGNDIDLNDSLLKNYFSSIKQGVEIIKEKVKQVDTIVLTRTKESIFFVSPFSSVKNRSGLAKISLTSNTILKQKSNLIEDVLWSDSSQLINGKFIYEISETVGDSVILGYPCKKLIIKETNRNNLSFKESRVLIIWATSKISPSISVYTFLWLHCKLLENLTPLYIEEQVLDPYPYTLFTRVISIN